ncbi:hypothetical protein EIP86_006082 [Pleurotus ostreatoroseus]|nr:hypothetical protein EIP86_006082 [Pleurotus ostreatoroseus]
MARYKPTQLADGGVRLAVGDRLPRQAISPPASPSTSELPPVMHQEERHQSDGDGIMDDSPDLALSSPSNRVAFPSNQATADGRSVVEAASFARSPSSIPPMPRIASTRKLSPAYRKLARPMPTQLADGGVRLAVGRRLPRQAVPSSASSSFSDLSLVNASENGARQEEETHQTDRNSTTDNLPDLAFGSSNSPASFSIDRAIPGTQGRVEMTSSVRSPSSTRPVPRTASLRKLPPAYRKVARYKPTQLADGGVRLAVGGPLPRRNGTTASGDSFKTAPPPYQTDY